MVQLITDSSCDLPKQILDKYNIAVVPLSISLDGNEYFEGVDLTAQEFFEKMFATEELPKTSQPSPAAFAEMFKKLRPKGELLCLTISSGISGTYQSACIGRDISETDTVIFDTLSGSLAHGILLIEAAKLAAQGRSAAEIVGVLETYRETMNILILLDNLENIIKGGRLSKFKGSVAKILDIKILLEGIHGNIEMKEKIRGKKRFYERVIKIIGERKSDFSETVFGITHADNLIDAEFFKQELIKKYNPHHVIINYMGSSMGTYAGKGGMIISFY